MKKLLKSFWYHKLFIIVFVIVGFLGGYFITEYAVNNNTARYSVKCNGDVLDFFNEDYFSKRLKEIEDHNNNLKEGEKKISIASLDYQGIISTANINKLLNDEYELLIKMSYAQTIFVNSSGKLNEGKNRLYKYLNTINDNPNVTISSEVNIAYYTNPYLVAGITAGVFLVSAFIFIGLSYKHDKEATFLNIADNETVFRTPFHLQYWIYSLNVFKSIKNLAIIGVLFAMMIASKFIHIPAGFGPLAIGFGYLFFSVIAMLYGPFAGLVIGMLSDILGFFLVPTGYPFFIGYTLDAMMAGFVYGICFYRTKVTFAKCLYARLFVGLIINVIFGSIWWGIINSLSTDATITYMLFISLPKNIVYLLPQSIILFLLLKALGRPFKAMGILDERIADNITIF